MIRLSCVATVVLIASAHAAGAQTPAPSSPPAAPSASPSITVTLPPVPQVSIGPIGDVNFAWSGQNPFGGSREEREEGEYQQARAFIEGNDYEHALTALDHVIAAKGVRADAAMYWKAYSLSKLARRTEALATLAALEMQYPNGGWVKDARALEVEVKQAAGQPVNAAAQTDDELKLLALRGLLQTDLDAVMPVLEKMLAGTSNVRVKDRAMFLLAQSQAPRARQLMTSEAKSGSNPDLRMQAIRYLGMMRAGTELEDLYRGDVSTDVKKKVIQSLSMANAADRLVTLARAEKNPELKTEIVRHLSMMRSPAARDYLLELLK